MRVCVHDLAELERIEADLKESGKLNEAPRRPNSDGVLQQVAPTILTLDELREIETQAPEVLIEQMIPTLGASLIVGPSKSCKTILAVQAARRVATRQALFDYYKVINPGPVLVIENDDPGGVQSIKQILTKDSARRYKPLCICRAMPTSKHLNPACMKKTSTAARRTHIALCPSASRLRWSRGSELSPQAP
jgi:hypothetical protein